MSAHFWEAVQVQQSGGQLFDPPPRLSADRHLTAGAFVATLFWFIFPKTNKQSKRAIFRSLSCPFGGSGCLCLFVKEYVPLIKMLLIWCSKSELWKILEMCAFYQTSPLIPLQEFLRTKFSVFIHTISYKLLFIVTLILVKLII